MRIPIQKVQTRTNSNSSKSMFHGDSFQSLNPVRAASDFEDTEIHTKPLEQNTFRAG